MIPLFDAENSWQLITSTILLLTALYVYVINKRRGTPLKSQVAAGISTFSVSHILVSECIRFMLPPLIIILALVLIPFLIAFAMSWLVWERKKEVS
jgi:hypothetical protein